MSKYKCILFDLDGTLIDTTPLILNSFRHTFECHFNECRGENELVKFLGIPLRTSFESAYPGMGDELVKTFRKYNEDKHDQYVGIFINIVKTLQTLKDNGIILGVVTSKRRELALRGMELFGIEKFMSVIIGYEDTIIHKPESEPLLKALDLLSIEDRDTVLYVGDSSYDIICAKNAGIKCAAVSWSYIPCEELKKCCPDFYLEKPEDLLKLI